jgi:hypothetical protein
MSAFKKLNRQDLFVTSYTSKKEWSISSENTNNNELQLYFLSKPNSSALYSGSEKYSSELLYKSLEHLYYSNFLGSLISGSYENYIQTTLESGSRKLDTENYLISITRKKIGQYIEPGSFKIQASSPPYTLEVVDDGEGNLVYFNPDPSISFTEGKVGDIIYTHGNVVIYGSGSFTDALFYDYNFTASWQSNYPILTQNVICKVSDFEFNFTQNPSAVVSGSDGKLADNITGSDFRPYITAIGLYNDANELIAVGKFGQPIPKPSYVDTTFILKLDL